MKNKNALQVVGMIGTSILTQVLVLIKSSILAANFGAGIELDAYNLTNSLTTFITTFLASGITTVILPAYVSKKSRKDVDGFISGLFIAVAFLYAALYMFRSEIVDIISGRSGEFQTIACNLMLYAILIQSVSAIVSVTAAYYQANDKFIIPKLIDFVTNLATVILLVFAKELTILQYVTLVLICSIVRLVVDVGIATFCGFRFCMAAPVGRPGTVELYKIFAPTVISSGVYQIHSLVDSTIASRLDPGSLTVLTYSNQIVTAVNSLIIGNLVLYAYPQIVKARNSSVKDGMETTWNYAVVFHSIICLLIVGFYSVGKQAIELLFQHGKFDATATMLTYICALVYIFGQQTNIIRDLIYRLFYSEGDTKTTLYNSVIVSCINIIVSILLVNIIGLVGIVIGTVISSACSLAMIIYRLNQKNKKQNIVFKYKDKVCEFIKNEIALVLTGAVVLLTKNLFGTLNIIAQILLIGIICVLVYFCVLVLLKSKCVKMIKR